MHELNEQEIARINALSGLSLDPDSGGNSW